MEKLSQNISNIIAAKLNYDDEKRAVIQYGLAAIFQFIGIFVITSIIGLFAGFWIESMVIFLSVGMLRKSTGGAHSETFQGCMIISILSICVLSILARYLIPINYPGIKYYIVAFVLLAFTYSFFIIHKKAPIDSPNKPIKKPEKIKRLRRNSFITLFIYFIAAITLAFLADLTIKNISVSLSITFATLWQVFTLSKAGFCFINVIDKKFR